MEDKKIIVYSHEMQNGMLDDDYTLYDDGTVLHFYDDNIYPGGQNLKHTMQGPDLPQKIKMRLLNRASEENKHTVKKLLHITE